MKAAKISLFALAGAVLVTAWTLFFVYTIHGPMFPTTEENKAGAAVGWVMAGFMLCMMLIFVLKTIFMSKKTSPETKKKLAPVYQIMNQFHMPIGLLVIGLLYLHFAMVFDITNASWVHFITGYVMLGLLALIAIGGFVSYFNKTPARKYLTMGHQTMVALTVVMFIIHLILK